MTDQHTFDALGCADHPVVETPNIDRLADRGVRFTDAYCPSPVCGPARASLFSGRYPRSHGVDTNGAAFDPGIDRLPALLSAAGYQTARVGRLHFEPVAAPHGFEYEREHDNMNPYYDRNAPWVSDYVQWLADRRFDGDVEAVIERAKADEKQYPVYGSYRRFLLGSNWRTEDEHSNTWISDRVVSYLENDVAEPFFLFGSYFGPHQPMAAPGRWRDMYDPEEVPLPAEFGVGTADKPLARADDSDGPPGWQESDYREILAAYYGQISMIDHGIGRVLDALEREGLREETVVVFTADHGEHAGQMGKFTKGTMYANSVRVPLVIAGPKTASGAACDRVVNGLDLFATVLDRCDVAHDTSEIPARSLVPLLENPDAGWLDRTYAELGDLRMVVDGDDKLVRTAGEEWHRSGEQRYTHELYDRTERPRDATNRWDRGTHQERGSELVALLDQFDADPDGVPSTDPPRGCGQPVDSRHGRS